MNLFVTSGYIANDIVIDKTEAGTSILKNTIAVRRQYKNKEGKYDTDFIRFTTFGKTAEFISQYLNKGDLVVLKGEIHTSTYDGKEGKVKTTDYIVDSVELLPKAKKEKEQQAEEITIDPEELPFY